MPSVSTVFEIPKFYYFDSGNNYSGSKGDFAYKIITGEKLEAMTWPIFCFCSFIFENMN